MSIKLQTSKNPILLNALLSSRILLSADLFLLLSTIETNFDFFEVF